LKHQPSVSQHVLRRRTESAVAFGRSNLLSRPLGKSEAAPKADFRQCGVSKVCCRPQKPSFAGYSQKVRFKRQSCRWTIIEERPLWGSVAPAGRSCLGAMFPLRAEAGERPLSRSLRGYDAACSTIAPGATALASARVSDSLVGRRNPAPRRETLA
jgi:hypothetical protein